MDRRDFLKTSVLAIAAGSLFSSVASSVLSKTLRLEDEDVDLFSLEAITDNSDYAVKLFEKFAKDGWLKYKTIKYSEFQVSGNVMGDLVFIKNNKLIDYTKSQNDFGKKLLDIRKELNLPSMLNNPVRIRLYTDNDSNLKNIIVVQRGKIIKRISPDSNDIYTFYGKSGKLVLGVNDGNARITETECRHKICKQMNSLKKQGDYIACIPNEIQVFAE